MLNRMIKLLGGLFFGLGVLFAVVSQAQAQESRLVRVGVYDNPPKIYRDGQGKITGIFGDILKFIAEKENWQINYVPGSFEDGLARLQAGEIDIMVDVADSPDRQQRYDLTSETVLSSWGVVYAQKNSGLDFFPDLNGKRLAILKSSVYAAGPEGIQRYIRAFDLDVELVELEEYGAVFDQLSKGEVDAALVSRISGLEAERDYTNIKATNMIFSPTELRFALTKGDADNPYLIERLDYWVNQLHEGYGGVYRRSLEKHGLIAMVTQIEVLPSWLLPVGLGGALFLLFSWFLIIGFRQALGNAVRRLAAKERYFSKLVDNAPVILSAIDKDGLITLAAGRSLSDIVEDPGKLVGASVFDQFRENPEVIRNIHRALAGEETHYQVEQKGRVFRVIATPQLVKGKVSEVLFVAVDVTEDNRLEKAKSEFITMVQHQLRTPPGAMKWGIELLSPKVEKILEPDELNIWRLLSVQTQRMINLANSLTLVSQVEANLFTIKPETFGLSEIVEEITKAHIELIKEKQLSIKNNFHDLQKVTHDKTIFGTMLQTLISNAVHYSLERGVIEIEIEEKPKDYVIRVLDSGKGIPESQQAKMFTRLFRGDQAARQNPEGLGISLYLTKTMLEQFGGKIWFESEPGKGSTFFVQLPKKIELPQNA